MNEGDHDRALKDAQENLITRKSTSRRNPKGFHSRILVNLSHAINFSVRGVLYRINK